MRDYSRKIAEIDFDIDSLRQSLSNLALFARGLKEGKHKWGEEERKRYPETVANLEGQIAHLLDLRHQYYLMSKKARL